MLRSIGKQSGESVESGVLSCWPDGLELTPGFYPGPNEQHRLF